MSLDLLNQIFEVCIIPLLGVLTGFLVNYIKKETNQLIAKEDDDTKRKYIEMLSEIVQDVVISTNQTYTDTLKAKGKFDEDAQKEAFNKTYEKVMALLTDEAKNCLNEAYSDLEEYIVMKIETAVRDNK